MKLAHRIAAALSGAIVGTALGCLVQLEHRIACGDGYTDFAAGEECDPQDAESFKDACTEANHEGGTAACHPVTCTIIATASQCQFCGDGEKRDVDEESTGSDSDSGSGTDESGDYEECDGDDLDGAVCPGGVGVPRCTSKCKLDASDCPSYCGDKHQDPGEECDFGGIDDFTGIRQCAGVPELSAPIPSPYGDGHPFGSGTARCIGCQWNRADCSYCGNGLLEADVFDLGDGTPSPPEFCDGDLFDEDTLIEQLGGACKQMFPTARRNVRCSATCNAFIEPVGEPNCCVRRGEFCPAERDGLECCHAYLHPEEADHCDEDPSGLLPPTCK